MTLFVTASFGAQNTRFAALVESTNEPGSLYRASRRETEGLTRVTNHLVRGSPARPERVAFKGPDDWDIEGWVLKPPDFDPKKRYPLILKIHGGPHLPYGHAFFHEFQALAGLGYSVLYTNPRGSHSYGEAFAHAVVGDHGGNDFLDLMAAVDHVVAQVFVDEDTRSASRDIRTADTMTSWILVTPPASRQPLRPVASQAGHRRLARDIDRITSI